MYNKTHTLKRAPAHGSGGRAAFSPRPGVCPVFLVPSRIFIELTLKAEQEEYAAEGIPWRDISYNDNKPLCELIENKPGLLSICDDCCNTAKTDLMFVNDLKSYFSGNVNIQCGQADFSVRHYAGDVRYVSDNFLTKNKGQSKQATAAAEGVARLRLAAAIFFFFAFCIHSHPFSHAFSVLHPASARPPRADTLFDDLIVVMQSSPAQFVRDHGWAAIEVTEGQKKKPPSQLQRRRAGERHTRTERA